MNEEKNLDFRIRYTGDIVYGKSISIRTLGNTLPHFQRAIDKAVLFEEDGKYKRNSGISRAQYESADLFLEALEDGSVVLPLYGKIKEGAINFYKWAMDEPYEEAVKGNVSVRHDVQIETYKTRHKEGDLPDKTQQNLMDDEDKNHAQFARSALLVDMSKAFNVIRTTGDHSIEIDITKNGLESSYVFSRENAKAFDRIVNTPAPTEPIIYKGRFNGYKEIAGKDFKFEVYVQSCYSKQMVHIYLTSFNDLGYFVKRDHGAEVTFRASPLQKYGAFDAYNGAAVFVGMIE